jgi:hypothetical protein
LRRCRRRRHRLRRRGRQARTQTSGQVLADVIIVELRPTRIRFVYRICSSFCNTDNNFVKNGNDATIRVGLLLTYFWLSHQMTRPQSFKVRNPLLDSVKSAWELSRQDFAMKHGDFII